MRLSRLAHEHDRVVGHCGHSRVHICRYEFGSCVRLPDPLVGGDVAAHLVPLIRTIQTSMALDREAILVGPIVVPGERLRNLGIGAVVPPSG